MTNIITNLTDLKNWAQSVDDAESSFALTVIGNELDAPAVYAVRNAARWCDNVVVLYLAGDLPTTHQQLLEYAGATQLVVPSSASLSQQAPCSVYMEKEGVSVTFLLQTILLLMPQAVSVSENDPLMHRCLNGILKTFDGLFVLMKEDTPMHLMSGAQKRLRSCLQVVQELYRGGETRCAALVRALEQEAVANNIQISHSFIDVETLQESHQSTADGLMLVACIKVGDQSIRDVIHF